MSRSWDVAQGWRLENLHGSIGYNTTITASTASNAKGGWSQINAAITNDAYGFLFTVGMAGSAVDYLVDIGRGAAGSEIVDVSNILWSSGGSGRLNYEVIFIPLFYPAGTRVAVRCQSINASATILVHIAGVAKGWNSFPLFGRATTYGDVTADSGGTGIDPGATANTKNTPVALTASTTNPMKACLFCIGNQANAADATQDYSADVMVGAASAEQVQLADLVFLGEVTGDKKATRYQYRYTDIPSGTRVSVRAQSSGVNATDRLFDAIVIGFG